MITEIMEGDLYRALAARQSPLTPVPANVLDLF
jgi:hypothetical protein